MHLCLCVCRYLLLYVRVYLCVCICMTDVYVVCVCLQCYVYGLQSGYSGDVMTHRSEMEEACDKVSKAVPLPIPSFMTCSPYPPPPLHPSTNYAMYPLSPPPLPL